MLQGGGPPYSPPWSGLHPLFDGIRHCNVLIERLEDPNQVPDRITSYNVCYTKLLRFGSGDEVTKQLGLTVKPAFWETSLAYIIYILLTIGIIWGSMKFYSERIKLRNSLLFEKKQRQLEHDFNA